MQNLWYWNTQKFSWSQIENLGALKVLNTHTHTCTHSHTHTCIRYLCVHAILQKASSPKPPRVGLTHNNSWLGLEAKPAPATTCQTLPTHTQQWVWVWECVCAGASVCVLGWLTFGLQPLAASRLPSPTDPSIWANTRTSLMPPPRLDLPRITPSISPHLTPCGLTSPQLVLLLLVLPRSPHLASPRLTPQSLFTLPSTFHALCLQISTDWPFCCCSCYCCCCCSC